MNEQKVIDELIAANVNMVISLPCDKNKGFTDMVRESITTYDITREEDGVGICAGAYLIGKRPIISIQSSGLGNMMNAIMSLTACYKLPLVILASWRGMDGEKIEAQIPFNSKIPQMLGCYDIDCIDVQNETNVTSIHKVINSTYEKNRIAVILIRPQLWKDSERTITEYPPRSRKVVLNIDKTIFEPKMTRLEAISEIMTLIKDDEAVVSNIGVPSKEVFASRDRPLNFYMLGSYTQATPIGLGMALASSRDVTVIDGDGSLLGSSILPVLSAIQPKNLRIVCVDNGTFGSTGNQTTPAYLNVDVGTVVKAYGINDVKTAYEKEEIDDAMNTKNGLSFIQIMIKPWNSPSPNLTYSATEIRDRFMKAL